MTCAIDESRARCAIELFSSNPLDHVQFPTKRLISDLTESYLLTRSVSPLLCGSNRLPLFKTPIASVAICLDTALRAVCSGYPFSSTKYTYRFFKQLSKLEDIPTTAAVMNTLLSSRL